MTDPRETLNRIRKQADAATEGPWMGVCDSDGYLGRVIGPDGFGIAEDFRDDADAEFTAAARTTVPALLDALEKVLELHESFEGSDSGGDLRCSGCYDSRYGVFEPYPCELVEAVTTALEAIK